MDKFPREYDGLSEDTECKVGGPAPFIPDGEYKEPQISDEKVTVPEEANYTPKGSWKILVCILACSVPLLSAGILALLKLYLPSGICAGAFALALTVFLTVLFAAEKRLLTGKNVLNKPDTRKIRATVTETVCTSRAYKEHRDSYGRFYDRELIKAVYAVTLKENGAQDSKTYVAKTEKYYPKGEEVAAYVRGKFAFIDETDPFNAQKTSTRKNR